MEIASEAQKLALFSIYCPLVSRHVGKPLKGKNAKPGVSSMTLIFARAIIFYPMFFANRTSKVIGVSPVGIRLQCKPANVLHKLEILRFFSVRYKPCPTLRCRVEGADQENPGSGQPYLNYNHYLLRRKKICFFCSFDIWERRQR